MRFAKYELEKLIAEFPAEKASLETDLTEKELDALSALTTLKTQAHFYLGKWLNFFFQKLFKIIDTRIRFFPEYSASAKDLPHTAEITIYYQNQDVQDIITRVVECVEPNFSIFIGINSLIDYSRVIFVFYRRLVYRFIVSERAG